MIIIWSIYTALKIPLFRIFLLFFYLASPGIPITHTLYHLLLSHSPWVFCCPFFHFCSLCFLVFEVSIGISSSSGIFSLAVFSLLISPFKAFFISVTMFLISSISFWFLKISIPLLTLPICSYIPPTLSIKAHSVLIIVVLNSSSDNSNIPAVSGLIFALFLQVVFFAFWYAM